nr:reverse transcriptase domain-containing protein [Tanacetum cinerariifolium]
MISMFAATTPENMPTAYRTSTSANPNPVISVDFIEPNYEVVESLLRDRHRRMRNTDLQTKLEYFNEDYDEEQEMEPIPESTRATTLPPQVTSLRIRRWKERTVGYIEDYPLPDRLKIPSQIDSYNGKGDPDNFMHLFEGAIRMQKWLMPVAYHMFTYTLKDSARIWWNSQKA